MTGLRRKFAHRSQQILILSLVTPFCLAQSTMPPPVAGLEVEPRVYAAEVQGDLLMVQRRYVAALDAYQTIPAKSAVVWNKTGMAYHHLFALDAARKDYEAALKLNPQYAEALNNLGAVYHAQHDYKQAERAYKRAIKYHPQSAVEYSNLGTTYFAEHNYKQGIKAYQKAFAVDPKIFDPGQPTLVETASSPAQRIAVNYSLARVFAGAGRQSQALASLRKALSCGFKDRKRLYEDVEFASLRQTTEFQQLLLDEHMQ